MSKQGRKESCALMERTLVYRESHENHQGQRVRRRGRIVIRQHRHPEGEAIGQTVEHQAYGDGVSRRRRLDLDVGLGRARAASRGMSRVFISSGRAIWPVLELELDVKDRVGRGKAYVVEEARATRTPLGALVVGMGRAQLLHDEHEGEAEEERQGDRGSIQRGRRPAVCECFDAPAVTMSSKQATIGLALWWLNNSQTYSGMMTPSAAPRRRPVPREESLDMCAPWINVRCCTEFSSEVLT